MCCALDNAARAKRGTGAPAAHYGTAQHDATPPHRNATQPQRNATQRNATQRNATHCSAKVKSRLPHVNAMMSARRSRSFSGPCAWVSRRRAASIVSCAVADGPNSSLSVIAAVSVRSGAESRVGPRLDNYCWGAPHTCYCHCHCQTAVPVTMPGNLAGPPALACRHGCHASATGSCVHLHRDSEWAHSEGGIEGGFSVATPARFTPGRRRPRAAARAVGVAADSQSQRPQVLDSGSGDRTPHRRTVAGATLARGVGPTPRKVQPAPESNLDSTTPSGRVTTQHNKLSTTTFRPEHATPRRAALPGPAICAGISSKAFSTPNKGSPPQGSQAAFWGTRESPRPRDRELARRKRGFS